jgi:hypothetical protein
MEFDKLTKCQHITFGIRGPSKNEPRISWINPIANFLLKNLTGKVHYKANKAIFGHFWAKIVFFLQPFNLASLWALNNIFESYKVTPK